MNYQKGIGLVSILAGVGLIIGAGVSIWSHSTRLENGATTVSQPTRLPPTPAASESSVPLWQSEPIVPTAAPPESVEIKPGRPISSAPLLTEADELIPSRSLERFGVGVPYPPLKSDTAEKLGLGWYLAWQVIETPPRPGNIEFWQMVRVSEEGYKPDRATIERAARRNRGTTWLIGNEPDVIWQDNVTPESYARWYHELYFLLKETDPTSQVAIGGVTQPTPLRLQYLERVLSAYQADHGQPMPVDVWNIHNFILREERDSWGVEIPPGLAVDKGILYDIDDHDDLEIFKTQIIDFRRWLADRGQRNKPLIISEYGILMPADYGFNPERVQQFLYGTYEFMLTATNEQTGYPADQNRLVQRWAWYSLSDDRYATGNFVDLNTEELTRLGTAHQTFIANLP